MKKHSRQEILLKLRQADELARAGKSQVEICKALGVSVMTFHRWRKLPARLKAKVEAPTIVLSEQLSTPVSLTAEEMGRHLQELTIENRRLRKIVTDLLLEKMKLEESTDSIPKIASPKKTVANDGL
jgi:transposase-like protein